MERGVVVGCWVSSQLSTHTFQTVRPITLTPTSTDTGKSHIGSYKETSTETENERTFSLCYSLRKSLAGNGGYENFRDWRVS